MADSEPVSSPCVVANCTFSASAGSGYCTLHGVKWDRPSVSATTGCECDEHGVECCCDGCQECLCDQPSERLLALVDRLLDPEVMQPFISAWEFEHDVDAEQLHDQLRSAREALGARLTAPAHPAEDPQVIESARTEP